jgi:hypothetical protein
LLGLLINPEVNSKMFLRNFGWISTDYTALYPRRLKSSAVTVVKYVKKNALRTRRLARRQTAPKLGRCLSTTYMNILFYTEHFITKVAYLANILKEAI